MRFHALYELATRFRNGFLATAVLLTSALAGAAQITEWTPPPPIPGTSGRAPYCSPFTVMAPPKSAAKSPSPERCPVNVMDIDFALRDSRRS